MNMLAKMNIFLDYENTHTINKAMRTLKIEFDIAKKHSSPSHADEVIKTARHIYDTLCTMEPTWHRRVVIRNLGKLLDWMTRNKRYVRNLDPENINEPAK